MDAYRSEILDRYISSGPMGQASALDYAGILSDILNSSAETQTRRITLSMVRSEDGWAYELSLIHIYLALLCTLFNPI